MRPTLACALAIALLALTPAVASAVTGDEIVRLSRAGVSDEVILALIDRDKTIFTIEADDLVTLKNEGVSEAVVLAMLKSGRAEGEAAVARQAALAAAEREKAEWLTPSIVVIGHGPDRPNTGYHDGFSASRPLSTEFFPGGLYPVPLVNTFTTFPTRQQCLAQGRTGPGGATFTYVTDCPLQLQQRRGRLAR